MAKYRVIEHWYSIDEGRYWTVEKKVLFFWKVLKSWMGVGMEEDRYYTIKDAEARVTKEQRVKSSIVIWASDWEQNNG